MSNLSTDRARVSPDPAGGRVQSRRRFHVIEDGPQSRGILGLVLKDVEHIEPASEEHTPHAPALDSVAETQRRERVNRRLLVAGDGLAALAATSLITWLTGHALAWGLLGVPLLAIVVAKLTSLYDRDEVVIHKSGIVEWRQVLQAAALTSIGVYLGWTVVTSDTRGGGMRVYLLLTLLSFGFTVCARTLARRTARAVVPSERCVIIGDPGRVSAIAERLVRAPGIDYVGAIPEDGLTGSVAELRAVVEQLHVHRVVIAYTGGATDERTLYLIQAAKFIGVSVSLLPSVTTAVGGVAAFDDLDGLILLGIPRFGLSRSSMRLKRSLDLLLGTVMLVILAPVLAVIALAIRLGSPGPILFRQIRIGRGGQPFEIYKFRSMVDGADAMKGSLLDANQAGDGLFKIVGDPRITRVGRHIRSTHLDELPQLLNVLRGEMSLVGPRPLVAEEDARVKGRDRHRVHLTPGMTGPWQIRGPMNTPLAEMAKLDYMYASTWSVWQDVDILLKTVGRVLNRGGH